MEDDFEIEEVNLVQTDGDKIQWLVTIVGCSEGVARRALHLGGGDISEALDHIDKIKVGYQTTDNSCILLDPITIDCF